MKAKNILVLILLIVLIALIAIFVLGYANSDKFKSDLDAEISNLQDQAEKAVNDALGNANAANNPKNDAKMPANYNEIALDENVLIHFIDAGQGDSILIQYKTENILIDAGDNGKGTIVSDYLKSKGVYSLKYLVGTHSDADHIGGMDELIKNGIAFEKYFGTYMPKDTKAYENLVKLTVDKKVSLFRGQLLDTKIPILVLNPTQKLEFNGQNDNSVVLYVDLGEVEILLMADCEIVCENSILQANLPVTAEILKIGHHGSYSSTGEDFLNKVNPQTAVILVGKDNDYGHPHKETLDKLTQKNVKIYRTDLDGTIVFNSDGKNYVVLTGNMPN